MKKLLLITGLSFFVLFSSCNKEDVQSPKAVTNLESAENGTRTSKRRNSEAKCPASYVTVTPCYQKFNFQLHYGPGGTGIVSPWCFDYILRNAWGVIIDTGNASHGGSTNPTPWVTPCSTYYIEFVGCCGSIYPFSMPLTSDGCGGIWVC